MGKNHITVGIFIILKCVYKNLSGFLKQAGKKNNNVPRNSVRNWIKYIFIVAIFLNCPKFEYRGFYDTGATFSPDGEYIAFAHSDVTIHGHEICEDTLVSGIYLMRKDGSELNLVMEGNGWSTDWTPDGEAIVFTIDHEIWFYDIERDSLVQLTNDGEMKGGQNVSPDGTKIAYTQGGESLGLYIINIDGSDRHRRDISYYPASDPEWSLDGKQFILMVWEGDQTSFLCQIDTNGTNMRKIVYAEEFGFRPDYFDNPRISPDGEKIVFYGIQNEQSKNWEIWTINTDGSLPKRIFKNGGIDPSWSPDGEWIIFSNGSTGGISLIKKDGTQHSILTSYYD